MNKKGFTLMELLGVLIILGIISSIAVMSVVNQYNKSKESSALESARAYIDIVNKYIVDYDLALDDDDSNKYMYMYNCYYGVNKKTYVYDYKMYFKEENSEKIEVDENESYDQNYVCEVNTKTDKSEDLIYKAINGLVKFNGARPTGEKDYVHIFNGEVDSALLTFDNPNNKKDENGKIKVYYQKDGNFVVEKEEKTENVENLSKEYVTSTEFDLSDFELPKDLIEKIFA